MLRYLLLTVFLLMPVSQLLAHGHSTLLNLPVDTVQVQNSSLRQLDSAILQGMKSIEVKLHVTRDGHAICIPDRNLKALTGFDINVDQITLATLRYLVSDVEVPTFDNYSAVSANKISLVANVGLIPNHLRSAFERSLRATYLQYGLDDLEIVGSSIGLSDSVRTVAVIIDESTSAFNR